MRHELVAAIQAVCRRPALALAVVLTLTLGIGANTAIFSAIDAVLLKPLPYPAADRLVAVYEANLANRQSTSLVAPCRLEEWNRMNHSFAGLAGTYFENMTDASGPLPERVAAMRTSPRLFAVLGVPAALGRTPSPEEERFGGPSVVVISDAFWRRRFDADAGVVGRSLVLGGASRTIVGVMPPSFRYPSPTTEVWVPAQAPGFLLQARQARFYTAIGRLRPEVAPEQAQADLSAVQAALGQQYPQTDKGWSSSVVPLKEEEISGVRRSLWLLLGAVALVLLAACGNVGCLMIADATRREHELAVRFALGASRATLIRQLLLESLVLAMTGAGCGWLLAWWGSTALRAAATGLPRVGEIQMDAGLAVFTLSLGVVTTLLFALAPALQATRRDVAAGLAHGGRGQVGGRQILQRVLVASQVSLAIVLLVGASLLIRSFARLQQVSPGFDPIDVVTFRMSAQWSERTDAVVARQFRTVNRLAAIPGVESAAFTQVLPAGADYPPGEFHIVGREIGEKLFAAGRGVGPTYFQTLHIPIVQGEACRNDPSVPPFSKVLVTQSFADRFFPDGDAIGHAVSLQSLPPGTSADIIGIVGNVRELGLAKDASPLMYWCGFQPYWPDVYFLVRRDPMKGASMSAIRKAMHEIEPGRAIYDVQALTDTLAQSVSQQRLNTLLLTLFAAMTLLLAGLGLNGTLAQYVAQRRREIGLRMALGAQPRHVLSQVVAHGAVVTAAGAGLGLAAAFAGARVMTMLVFGISPRDPATFVAVPIVFLLIAAVATAVPARRAVRVDPITALRED